MTTEHNEGEKPTKAEPSVKLERVEPVKPGSAKWIGGVKPPTERKSIREDPSGKSNK